MQVQVKLYATLQLSALGTTVGDLVIELKLLRQEMKLFFVKGRARPIGWPLEPGDAVDIFPVIGGG